MYLRLHRRSTVCNGLASISNVSPTTIESITLPVLFHSLPERAPTLAQIGEREQYREHLQSLSKLCVQPALFETLVIRITTKLDLLSSNVDPASVIAVEGDEPMDEVATTEDYRECEVAFAWDMLNCLSRVIDAKIQAKHVDVIKQFDRIVPRLYTLAVGAAAPSAGRTVPLFRDQRLLSIIGTIVATLLWQLSVE